MRPRSRAVCARVPHTTMAAAASTLITANPPLAVPFFDPPMPNSAPWFTRGMSGALHACSAPSVPSFGGTLRSNCAINLNQPGTTSTSLPVPLASVKVPSRCNQRNTPYFVARSVVRPATASSAKSQR